MEEQLASESIGIAPDPVFTSPQSVPLNAANEHIASVEIDPDSFPQLAKSLVVNNYNRHRDVSRSPKLTIENVHLVWFVKTGMNWKAIVSSPIIRGLMWEVTASSYKNEAYIEVYKRLNNVKVKLN